MGGQERGSESRRGKAASEVEGEERMESGPVETTVSKERDGYQERECEIEESSLLGRFRLRVNRREKIRRGSFKSLYSLGSMLGKGGCGAVYAAICKTNGRQVAIKYVKKGMAEPYVKLPGLGQPVPLEVALMQIVSHPPACPYVLQLLEWFQEAERFILVLERPYSCMDLFDFMEVLGGQMDECLARAVMIQVVLATCHCRERGVLHRDVKVENLLVQTDTLKIKLIDFGCGDLLRTSSYRDYSGTEEFCPPEWVLRGVYQGRPATVWSLGVLLFSMVCGYLPFNQEADIISGRPRFTKDLSKQCKKLIGWCLQRDPTKRPVLEQILLHDWMIASEASEHSRPTVHPPPSNP
ncbi:serine/threonine-protein kinase pim-2-like [Hypomesus transpacificus]|uniref:serine/threonine-protein kinase pim-2-like n=1 Tax=Hypomesus transpacificus TaxID=137520 RepID=UPI001F084AB4|nr:serine/threonine-protein kinase pim-2-like [Hypomesus transpacificus]